MQGVIFRRNAKIGGIMSKEEFKKRWESNEQGGGITFNDIADCYINWGLGTQPRCKPINYIVDIVLKAAGVEE